LLSAILLTGCSNEDALLDQAMELRKSILEGECCTFQAQITADYTDVLYTFHLDCTADQNGNLHFTVKDPASIAGISGQITSDDAVLQFDDKVLAFPMLADGELAPISAPWIFMQTLRSGYITGCGSNGEEVYLYIDDSYEEYPLHLEIQTDADLIPHYAEIIWQDRRILSMHILNFTIQ
jgi:hypothetical protein